MRLRQAGFVFTVAGACALLLGVVGYYALERPDMDVGLWFPYTCLLLMACGWLACVGGAITLGFSSSQRANPRVALWGLASASSGVAGLLLIPMNVHTASFSLSCPLTAAAVSGAVLMLIAGVRFALSRMRRYPEP